MLGASGAIQGSFTFTGKHVVSPGPECSNMAGRLDRDAGGFAGVASLCAARWGAIAIRRPFLGDPWSRAIEFAAWKCRPIRCHSGQRTRLQPVCCRVQLAISIGVHDRAALAGINQSFALVEGWAIGVA